MRLDFRPDWSGVFCCVGRVSGNLRLDSRLRGNDVARSVWVTPSSLGWVPACAGMA